MSVDLGEAWILLVAPRDAATNLLAGDLADDGVQCLTAHTRASALALMRARRPTLVVSVVDLPDGTGFELLAEAQRTHPELGRFLWARYDELPRVVREGASVQLERVLARPGRSSALVRTLRERLELGDPFNDGNHTEQFGQLFSVVLRATNAFARMHGAVVRSLPKDAPLAQLQLVVPFGEDLDRIRIGLAGYFGEAVKARGAPIAPEHRDCPLFEILGALQDEQEAYFVRPSMQDGVYVALFPWRKEGKCTVVVGVTSEGDALEGDRVIHEVRERVVQEMGEFVVPRLDGQGIDKARYVPEYDWVVTDQYAGPDRRSKPTGFASSFLAFGKRAAGPAGLDENGGFVDRFRPWVLAAFAAYLLLSSIDTVLTWVVIGGGKARELNPLLRPLVGAHPIAFTIVKNLLSTTSFIIVARLQLFRVGKLLVAANLLLYIVLDCYWAILVQRLLKSIP